MGLLDGALGSVLGSVMGQNSGSAQNMMGQVLGALGSGGQQSGGAQQTNIIAALMSFVQKNGGINKILQMFNDQGLGAQVQSWLSTGQNMPISADQVTKVLGQGNLQSIATQANAQVGDVSSVISKVLPELINQFSPKGQLASNHSDLLNKGLAFLQTIKR